MALSATRRLAAAAAGGGAAAPKLSSLFAPRRAPKPRPPPPDSGDEPRRRKPRVRQRQPWEEAAAALLRRLHEGRYLPGPDLSSVPHVCNVDAVKGAAERFGHDHQVVANSKMPFGFCHAMFKDAAGDTSSEIIILASLFKLCAIAGQIILRKWLSGSDLKKIALFGCPSVERRTVFASKRLRAFFNIQENKICSSCKLRSSCTFVDQGVARYDKVILSDIMRIFAVFVMDACSHQLRITPEFKASVCKLLKDTINLSS
ncbi:hypothetical protein ACP4OV_031391 [Aristida adscensionis]